MTEFVEKVREMLKRAGLQHKHLEVVFEDNQKNKAALNEMLGLSAENHYRKVMELAMSDAMFNQMYPFVKQVFQQIPGWEGPLSPTSGKVKVGRDMVNITKFLSKQLADGKVPLEDKRRLMQKLKIDCDHPKAEAQIVPKFGELLNKKHDNVVVVSTNPFDFFTGSAGDFNYASFKSCFRPGGEYFNGCNSLARDSFSMIAYKAAQDKMDYKHGRAWMFVLDQIVAQTKSYGTFTDTERKLSREFVEKCVAAKHGINPESYKRHLVEKWKSSATSNRNVLYFDDYSIDLDYPAAKFPKGFTDREVPHVAFSHARCLKCGRETLYPQSGICGICSGSYSECNECHSEIVDGRATRIGNKYLCRECLAQKYDRCPCCNGWYEKGQDEAVSDGLRVCKTCFRDAYFKCDHCNEYHQRERGATYKISNLAQTWCKKCFKSDGFTCKDCGENHSNDVLNTVVLKDATAVKVCGKCVKAYSVCVKCQTAFRDGHETSDGAVCPDCFPNYDYCTHCSRSVPKDAMTFDGLVISCADCAVKREAKEATPGSYIEEITNIMDAVKAAEIEKNGNVVAVLKELKISREDTGFLKGDVVRVLVDKTYHGYPVGKLVTICSKFVSPTGKVSYCTFRDNTEWFLLPEEFEFVRPAIVAGDTVKSSTKGVVTVTGVSEKENGALVYATSAGSILAEKCEPTDVIDPEALNTLTYKVGEMLEIIADVSKHGFTAGDRVKVYRADFTYGMPRYFVKKGRKQGCIWGGIDAQKAAPIKKAPKKIVSATKVPTEAIQF